MMTEKVVLKNIENYVKTMLGDETVEVELSDKELQVIINQALRKLRHPSRSRKLRDYLEENS